MFDHKERAERAYGKVLQFVQFTPGVNQGFFQELDPKHVDKRTDNRYGNVPNNYWSSGKDAPSSDRKHDACQTAIASAGDKKQAVRVH